MYGEIENGLIYFSGAVTKTVCRNIKLKGLKPLVKGTIQLVQDGIYAL